MDAHDMMQRVQQLQERLGHTQDPRKISKTLKSLQGLEITLEILVETGVGKTVNGFRKHTEVGDIAKSIVNQWKKLVPEVTDLDQKPKPKWEHRETLDNKAFASKLKYEQKEAEEKKPNLRDRDRHNADPPESGTLKKSSKTETLKVSGKSKSKEKPSKADKPHSHSYSHSHSKCEKSKSFQPDGQTNEPYHYNIEKKRLSSKSEEKLEKSRPQKNELRHSGVKQSVEQSALSMFSTEEFDAPTMSFESYLSYDQVSTKRKKKSHPTNEPPRKVQVCKQYCNMEQVRAEVQSDTEMGEEKLDNSAEVKKRCFEDLLNIPLPKVLPDYSIYPSPPHYMDCKGNIPEPLAEIQAESSGFTGKRQNTKMLVYSGSKTMYLPKMLTLYDQCIRILQNNIDSIQEVGGVPFEILEPVLKRCTPEQLNRIEECNPTFMEDSYHLWKKHCERDFKGHRLLEYESWREMYLRLFSEREEKLKMITHNISSTHSGKPKGRQVKLAYIHEVAKPPRNIRRKQEIHGTAGPIVQPHPIDKIKLQKVETKESVSNKNPSVPLSNNHYGGPCQDSKKAVRKIAPMMAKSMRAFKNRVGPR